MPDMDAVAAIETKTEVEMFIEKLFSKEAIFERTKMAAEEISGLSEYRKAHWQYTGNFRELMGIAAANPRQEKLLAGLANGVADLSAILIAQAYSFGCADTIGSLANNRFLRDEHWPEGEEE
jgi:hypothetical protein